MKSRRQILTALGALAALVPVRPAISMESDGKAVGDRLRTMLESIFDEMMRYDPSIATGLGVDVGSRGALRYKLKESGVDNRLGAQRALVEALPRLRQFDRRGLDSVDPYYLDSVIWAAERAAALDATGFGTIDNWPTPYVINQISGAYQNVPDFLRQQHRIDTKEDADAYLYRLEDFARLVAAECSMLESDADRGIIAPGFILDLTMAQTDRLRKQTGAQSDLTASLARRAAERRLPGNWEADAARIIDGPLARSLERQHVLLERLRERATTNASLGRLPGGEEFYAKSLRMHVTTAASIDDIHRIGVVQVEEISAKIDSLLRAQSMTRGSIGERLGALNVHPAQLYPNDDAGRAQIMAYLERLLDDARASMSTFFNDVPASPVDIRRIPKANELGAVAAYALPGSVDGVRPGTFYINLRDTSAWPKYSLPTLAFHEAIPGHLWNAIVAQRTKGVPMINQHFYFAAYTEGWALYAEELADEAGLYAANPLGRIGLQQGLLMRAARIVADTGIHAKGWDRQQAVDYMVRTVGIPLISAEGEVDRYCVLPGQACGYKIGHTEIRRMLSRSQAALGSRFDLKDWHDVVLSGTMPLEILDRLLLDWERDRS